MEMFESGKIYFYPVWLRIWHAINALGIITLIITGISMQSSSEAIVVKFNTIVTLHNITGIVLSISYLFYFIANITSRNVRFYVIKPKGFFKKPLKQAHYYILGMFRGEEKPFPLTEKRKFNPLQKYFYVLVMYFIVPVVIITGIALLFPEIIAEKIYTLNGVLITAVLHSAVGFFISIFLVIHLYVATIGKSPFESYKSIINGWHHIEH
jgi:thiosulfate reductase cytochrome b subunit